MMIFFILLFIPGTYHFIPAQSFTPFFTKQAVPIHMRTRNSLATFVANDKTTKTIDIEIFNTRAKEMRMKHLEDQAMYALKIAVEKHDTAVFSNALIAGDVVITDLLHRMGYLQSRKVKVLLIDTFHLFPSTIEFLKVVEDKYDFKAEIFGAEGITIGNKATYDARYGRDLWKEDIDEYDRVSKVEPFQRGLKTMKADVMISGRTRWQGAERAWIDMVESATIDDSLILKLNPIAYWTLEDIFDYMTKYKTPYHPLHELGYPSIGDAKDTFPVPEDGSVRFVNYEWIGDKSRWLEYGRERVGRFVGLTNSDGSTKTECGIHVNGSERTWDRDLWEDGKSSVTKIITELQATNVVKSGKPSILVVYAPWCPFSQRMEEEYEKLATDLKGKIDIYSFRGDDKREFVTKYLNTKSFPTVNVIKENGTAIKYESEVRTVEAFKEFLHKTVGEI
jgi:phosphoadenylyl-sulfate reductase (thioredoxin)